MENYLYNQLQKFNKTVPNPYRENWGSTMTYLPTSYQMNGRKVDEVQTIKMYQNQQNQAV